MFGDWDQFNIEILQIKNISYTLQAQSHAYPVHENGLEKRRSNSDPTTSGQKSQDRPLGCDQDQRGGRDRRDFQTTKIGAER